ncbi:MAG: hypothetical protein ACHBNF_00315 [Chromatiales bacterium]
MKGLHEQVAYATTESALDRLGAFLARRSASSEAVHDMEGFEMLRSVEERVVRNSEVQPVLTIRSAGSP